MGRPLERLDWEVREERTRVALQSLRGHHRSMVRDKVAGGLRNHELAKMYGMSEAQISIIVNSPAFITEEARLEAEMEESVVDVKQRLLRLAPQATRVLTRNLFDQSDEMPQRQLATKSAIDILDRVGAGKDTGLGTNVVNILQANVDARGLSTEKLREDIFELLKAED